MRRPFVSYGPAEAAVHIDLEKSDAAQLDNP